MGKATYAISPEEWGSVFFSGELRFYLGHDSRPAISELTVVKMNDLFSLQSSKIPTRETLWYGAHSVLQESHNSELVIVAVSLTANQYTMFYGFIFCPSYNSTTETLFS